MKLRKMSSSAVTLIIIIVLVSVSALLFFFPSRQKIQIVIPEVDESRDLQPDDTGNGGGITRVEITNDTVQTAIETLKRPEDFYRSIVINKYWEGGGTRYYVDIYKAGKKTKIISTHEGYETKNILITEDRVYIWYNNEREPLELSRLEEEDYLRAEDAYQMIATYEDVLRLDKDSILDSGYRERDGKYYIYVKTEDEIFGYIIEYYISAETGLLQFAEKKDGDFTIYKMAVNDEYIERPSDNFFMLP
jgi:hypothetical protein